MFGIEALSGGTQAATLIGIVLVEAVILYVGYGVLEAILGESVMEFIRRV